MLHWLSQITWADVYFTTNITFLQLGAARFNLDPEFLTKYPLLNALSTRVQQLPAIAKWIQERPQTEM